MTEHQIVKRFRYSSRPLVEIGEIADELHTTAPEIIRILIEHGIKFNQNKEKNNGIRERPAQRFTV